ncbi:MAG: hypothetical protein V1678_02215 [Candidatus Aenigmatarchaeota archaeon]
MSNPITLIEEASAPLKGLIRGKYFSRLKREDQLEVVLYQKLTAMNQAPTFFYSKRDDEIVGYAASMALRELGATPQEMLPLLKDIREKNQGVYEPAVSIEIERFEKEA